MKPIFLTIQAFGPFSDKVELDFRELGSRSFLLINGPTGAGKTTILDAVCFALYGDTSSGDERLARQMRSQHAQPETPTTITLDFALGDKKYRISRTPEQELPKKKGDGYRKYPPQAVLWDRTHTSGDDEEGTVLADKWSAVTEETTARLGFHSEQFRQVIMLPQGRFRRLLLAKSSERQEILEALFQTEVYRRIEEQLQKSSGETKALIEEFRRKQKSILEIAQADTPDQLTVFLSENRKKQDALAGDIESLRIQEAQALNALNQAYEAARKLSECREAEKAVEELARQAEEYDKKQGRLDSARKASSIIQIESFLIQRRKEMDAAEKEKGRAEKALKSAEAEKADADEKFEYEKSREAERKELAIELNRLERLRPKLEAMEQLKKSMDDAAADAKRKQESHKKSRDELEKIKTDIETTEKRIEETRGIAGGFNALSLEQRQLTSHLEQRKKLDMLQKQIVEADGTHKSIGKKVVKMENDLAAASDQLVFLQNAWEKGQASILAQGLEKGEPCPVCGSLEHPSPTPLSADVPSEADLKTAQDKVKKLQAGRDKLKVEESEINRTLSVLMNSETGLRDALGDYKNASTADLENILAAKEKEVKTSESANLHLKRLEKQIENLKNSRKKLEGVITAEENDLQEAGRILTEIEANYRAQSKEVPADLKNPSALNKVYREKELAAKKMEKAFNDAQAAMQTAMRNVSAGAAKHKASVESFENSKELHGEQAKAFHKAVADNGFKNIESYQEAKLTDDQITNLETLIKKYQSDVQTASDRRDRAIKEAQGLTMPDLPALEKASRDVRKTLEDALKEKTRLEEEAMRLREWRNQWTAAQKELEKHEKAYYTVGRLADVAAGKNPRNLTFQRFVLGALLDDVLVAATSRLKIMSAGRYQLERSEEGRDRRTAWGLDLQVSDAYTGQSRPVSTLSGGESFLAALALALGLADVVQAHSGGVHMDAVFVDEGFGSLDPEALDLALRALIDLQKGGRLVSVISHVPELRERIETRLDVIRGRNGSSAVFSLG